MNTDDKIPLKLVEISIEKFNNTIPQYLSLLKNHKCNIVKCVALKDWDKVKKEEINATRIIKQMKYLILEIDEVRARVRDGDLEKFDEMIEGTKKVARGGMKEYLDMQLKISPKSHTNVEDENEDELAAVPKIQAMYNRQEDELKKQQDCLNEFENLQREIEDVQDLFVKVHELAVEQRESVDKIEENVEVTQVQVEIGTSNLKKALKYKKAIYPLCGALLGTCIGGPIGFVAGLKAGGLAAIGGGFMGFAGGKMIKNEEEKKTNVEGAIVVQLEDTGE